MLKADRRRHGRTAPGYFANLLIDELSFTVARIGQVTGQRS